METSGLFHYSPGFRDNGDLGALSLLTRIRDHGDPGALTLLTRARDYGEPRALSVLIRVRAFSLLSRTRDQGPRRSFIYSPGPETKETPGPFHYSLGSKTLMLSLLATKVQSNGRHNF